MPSERDLADQFGVSRNTLREALRSLEIAGLLELKKGATGGAFIREGGGDAVVTGLSDLYRLGNIRPEHLTEAKHNAGPNVVNFETQLDVTEPMGMETYVYTIINGTNICGRVGPNAGARDGQPFIMGADLNNMHLIDETSGRVL